MVKTSKIKVRLTRSMSGSTERQIETLKGLGLKKVNATKVLVDTPAIRGMVNKVSHLVSVEEI